MTKWEKVQIWAGIYWLYMYTCKHTIKENNSKRRQWSSKFALRYYASGSFLEHVEVIKDYMGFNKGTVSRVIDDVINALLVKKDDYIKWPTSVATKNSIKCGFYVIGQFPNCIGCIDGTHVRIQRPSEDEVVFL